MFKKVRISKMPKNIAEKTQLLSDINKDSISPPNIVKINHTIIFLILISSNSCNTFPPLFSLQIPDKAKLLLKKLIALTTHFEQACITHMEQVLVYAIPNGFLDMILQTNKLHNYYNKVLYNTVNQLIENDYKPSGHPLKIYRCALFNHNSFKIPKLKHIVTIFMHRNIGIRYQQTITHTICDFSPQAQIIKSLVKNAHCPPTHVENLLFLAKYCPIHNTSQVTRINEKRLNKYHILIVKNSKFYKELLTAGISKFELNKIYCEASIHYLAFDNLYSTGNDLAKVLNFIENDTVKINNFDPEYDQHFLPQ